MGLRQSRARHLTLNWLSHCGLATALAVVPFAGATAPVATRAQSASERITINDNRRAAGTLAGGTLTIRLEARIGEWRPDGDASPGIMVKAFAVDSGPLQVPGPLIRVQEGTEIRAVVRNRLDDQLAVHGLYARPGQPSDAPVIAPGETREFTFLAGSPGTYFYWGATEAATLLGQRRGADTQLTGAFVVDPRGRAPGQDRVLLIGNWTNNVPLGETGRAIRFVINGRSWPHTERLTYRPATLCACAWSMRAPPCTRCICTASTSTWTAAAPRVRTRCIRPEAHRASS